MISLVFASRSATLTDATDLVRTANNHGFSANNQIKFLTITSTTGISTNTWYYVANNVSLTANTFQLTASAGSAVLPLTTNGTATIAIPISPIQTSKPTTAFRRLTRLKKFVAISPVTILKNISYIKPYWDSIDKIKTNFSSVINLPAVISIQLNTKITDYFKVKFTPINTVNVLSSLVTITNITSELVQMSFVNTIAVVTRKLPIPRDTWANVTQQVKTLIQFWS